MFSLGDLSFAMCLGARAPSGHIAAAAGRVLFLLARCDVKRAIGPVHVHLWMPPLPTPPPPSLLTLENPKAQALNPKTWKALVS